MKLHLAFVDNETLHADIILNFAGRQWLCDSYYFALDRHLLPECEDAAKIGMALRRLLEQWHAALKKTRVAEAVFLPYDFSDQYTGWLRCTRTDDGFVIVRGWSGVEGWSLSPSNIGNLLYRLESFHADGPTVEMSAGELFDAIDRSLSLTA